MTACWAMRVAPWALLVSLVGCGSRTGLEDDTGRRPVGAMCGSPRAVDFTGDGFADVAISEGNVVRLYLGGPSGLRAGPERALDVDPQGRTPTLRNAGDLDGDGRAELVATFRATIRADLPSSPPTPGRVDVIRGDSSGFAATPAVRPIPTETEAGYFGATAAAAGDMNGDGFADLAVGSLRGRPAFFYAGSAAGLNPIMAGVTVLDATRDDGTRWVRGVGDFDGDGFDDAVLFGETRALLRFGARDWNGPLPTVLVTDDRFVGPYVDGVGDVDGDGRPDIFLQQLGPEERLALARGGSRTARFDPWVPTIPSARPQGTLRLDGTVDFEGAGDINGDGRADLLLAGDCWASASGCGARRYHLYAGTAAGLSLQPLATIGQGPWGDNPRVRPVGDVDGDCRDDVVVVPRRAGERLWLLRGTATGFAAPVDVGGRGFAGAVGTAGALP